VQRCVKERTVASRPSGSKKPKQSAWEIYRLKGSPTAFVGVVYAEDEEGAIAVAIEEHNVRPADQWRLFARPHE
jgi:hypothetical protein